MKPKPDSLSLLGTFVKWNPIFVVVVVVVVVVFEKKRDSLVEGKLVWV